MTVDDDSRKISLGVPGAHNAINAALAIAACSQVGISMDQAIAGLGNLELTGKRLALRESRGIRVIDDTYNASPESTLAALNLLDDIDGRKIAVLGDMLELGQYEREGHRRVGLRASEIVLVGELSKITQEAVLETSFNPQKLHWFANADGAIDHLKPTLQQGDIVLVKSSHSMHLESIVFALEEVH